MSRALGGVHYPAREHELLVPEQLELFARSSTGRPCDPDVTWAEARLAVSPGWWRLVRPLFELQQDVVVHECHEVSGELHLGVNSRDGGADGHVHAIVQQIRDAAAHTCGACGKAASKVSPDEWGTPRTVCSECHERLETGESFLLIADRQFRLDGSSRPSCNGPVSPVCAGSNTASERRACSVLSPDELRGVIREFKDSMTQDVVGQDEAMSALALSLGLHVGGGLPRGGRVLLLGPSGVGKTSTIIAMRRALEAGRWDVPVVATDALDLTSPGWAGLSLGHLLESALGDTPPDSVRARHAIVAIDELAHAGLQPGLHGNSLAHRREVLASLLSLFGHGVVHLGDGAREWSSRNALVFGMGAFTDSLEVSRVPSPRDLVRAGIPFELATRFEETILLRPLPESELLALLRRWPGLASLTALCERMGITVRIHDETYRRAARAVCLAPDEASPRTAGSWMVTALRHALLTALATNDVHELAITPDDLSIARTATQPSPPNEPPDSTWDATIIPTPR